MGIKRNKPAAREVRAFGYPGPNGRQVFSSDDFGPGLSNKARLTAWRDIFSSGYGASDFSWHGEGEFRACSEFIPLGDTIAGTIDFNFDKISRTARHIADDVREDLVIGFMRDAPVQAKLGNNEIDAPAGPVFFYSMARLVEFSTNAGQISGDTIVLPHAALAPIIPDLDDLVGCTLNQANPAVNLLKRYVELIVTSPGSLDQPALKEHIRHTLVDLAAIAIGGGGENVILAADRGQRAARLATIKADVRDNIGRQDVSVQAIATRHGITPRYLHMLFEGVGQTFSEFVISERLAKAHRFLADPRRDAQRIGDIAFAVGFADLSTFNRQFKRQYGMTPSDLRAASLRN